MDRVWCLHPHLLTFPQHNRIACVTCLVGTANSPLHDPSRPIPVFLTLSKPCHSKGFWTQGRRPKAQFCILRATTTASSPKAASHPSPHLRAHFFFTIFLPDLGINPACGRHIITTHCLQLTKSHCFHLAARLLWPHLWDRRMHLGGALLK